METRIIEAGHYYQAKGPTEYARRGWELLQSARRNGDKSMLFIDDVHTMEDVHHEERELEVVAFRPDADYVLREADVREEAEQVFQLLMSLSKRHRPRKRDENWVLNGNIRLKHPNGEPTCVLLDAGLSLKKMQLGFRSGINILPVFYRRQQESLQVILRKALPCFQLETMLFDQYSNVEVLRS
ncbi:MAG: hypothetical protein A2666_05520 [Parcubacteria group bacterium RIFCSPHIGHO2_01_FULL_47_10b]|nr:MAG: hypothetical protein A2666_05520 [Parcubacteria group bacterium RIFCSPHIGHO2_01_FULL_47_10b]